MLKFQKVHINLSIFYFCETEKLNISCIEFLSWLVRSDIFLWIVLSICISSVNCLFIFFVKEGFLFLSSELPNRGSILAETGVLWNGFLFWIRVVLNKQISKPQWGKAWWRERSLILWLKSVHTTTSGQIFPWESLILIPETIQVTVFKLHFDYLINIFIISTNSS